VWAKISTSATALACAACLAASAATLPAVEKAGSDLANNAAVKLAVDFSKLAAFDAIPAYIGLAGGDLTQLNNLASLSAINPYIGLAGGDLTQLNNLSSLSAINPYIALAGGDITATGDLASVSAVNTFFGDGPLGTGGVFTGGGIDALAPDAAGNGGYAALSALPVFVGSQGLLTTGNVNALSNYAALSAIPAYLAPTPPPATTLAATGGGTGAAGGGTTVTTLATLAATGAGAAGGGTTGTTLAATGAGAGAAGGGTTGTTLAAPLAAKVAVDPAPVVEKTPTPTANKNGSYSASFAPKQLLLFGSGGGKNAADNGISGWGDMLKKVGLNGGAPAAGAPAGGTGGTP
jgi:hypothetical protein